MYFSLNTLCTSNRIFVYLLYYDYVTIRKLICLPLTNDFMKYVKVKFPSLSSGLNWFNIAMSTTSSSLEIDINYYFCYKHIHSL